MMDWNLDANFLASLLDQPYQQAEPQHGTESYGYQDAYDVHRTRTPYNGYSYDGSAAGEHTNFRSHQEEASHVGLSNAPNKEQEITMQVQKHQASNSIPLPGISASNPPPAFHNESIEDKAAQLRAKILENKRASSRASMADKIESSNARGNQKAPNAPPSSKTKEPDVDRVAREDREPALRSSNATESGTGRAQQNFEPSIVHSKVSTGRMAELDAAKVAVPLQRPPEISAAEPGLFAEPHARDNTSNEANSNGRNAGDVQQQASPVHSRPENPKEHLLPKKTRQSSNVTKEDSSSTKNLVTENHKIAKETVQEPDVDDQAMAVVPANAAQRFPGNAAEYSHYFDDLDEWLELTGYHDREHREKFLQRERRRHQLQAELDALDREEDQKHARPSVRRMPPPPVSSTAGSSRSVYGSKGATALAPTAAGAKRNLSTDGERPAKQQKVENTKSLQRADAEQRPVATSSRELFGSKLAQIAKRGDPPSDRWHPQSRSVTEDPSFLRQVDQNYTKSWSKPSSLREELRDVGDGRRKDFEDRGRLVVARSYRDHDQRSLRGLSRERYYDNTETHNHSQRTYSPNSSNRQHSTRPGQRPRIPAPSSSLQVRFNSSGRSDTTAVHKMEPRSVRYFMIKSWNHENVEAAMRDNTWATQPHNEQLLANAFKTTKDVILVYSVNKSMAFQGFARMESLPGTAPEPSWVKQLLWPSSPPFYIRWLQIADTRFSKVGHLKNSYNEGQPVLIGRDGQEIEEHCGRELCRLIEIEASRRDRYNAVDSML